MELTDGTQNIEAIEYEAIPSLSVDLTPGCKVGLQILSTYKPTVQSMLRNIRTHFWCKE